MNKKQKILLCYFTIAIISLAIFGFLSGTFGKLSGIIFIMIIVSLIGLVSLIVSGVEEGIDIVTFKNKILPVSLILIYFFLSLIILNSLHNSVETRQFMGSFMGSSLIIFFLIYIPIGMTIVLLTSAKNHFNDEIPEHVPFLKRFAAFAITYTIGIAFFPFFLNSWFTKEKKRSLLDELIHATYGNPPPLKSANLSDAIAFATDELLGGVVSRTEVTKIATELFESPMPYSTHDLAYAAALNFFKAPERRGDLMDAQLMARAKMLELLQEKKLNVHLAKAFEDKLYKDYKPTSE